LTVLQQESKTQARSVKTLKLYGIYPSTPEYLLPLVTASAAHKNLAHQTDVFTSFSVNHNVSMEYFTKQYHQTREKVAKITWSDS